MSNPHELNSEPERPAVEDLLAGNQKQREQLPSQSRAIRTVRIQSQRRDPAPTSASIETDDDAPIKTLHRSTATDTRVLIGVILVALLLCLLGFVISLTSTPKPPTLLQPSHAAAKAQTSQGEARPRIDTRGKWPTSWT